MSDIQDEAYSEAMEEIERLREQLRLAQVDNNHLKALNAEERKTTGELAALCRRAADALEGYWPVEQDRINKLIAELREGAE